MAKIKFSPKGFYPGGIGDDKYFNYLSFYHGEINPRYSYYAGDIATLDIFENFIDSQNFFPKGYIYPCPILIRQTNSDENLSLSNSKLGVFMYFEFTPLGQTKSIRTECFVAGTPIEEGTTVKAVVVISDINKWHGKLNTYLYSKTGIRFKDQLRPLQVFCDDTYLVNMKYNSIKGIELLCEIYFPKGNDHILYGRSKSYLKEIPDECVNSSIKPTDFTSVFFLDSEDSKKTNPSVYFSFYNNL